MAHFLQSVTEYEGHKVRGVPRALVILQAMRHIVRMVTASQDIGAVQATPDTGADQLKLERCVEHGASCATQNNLFRAQKVHKHISAEAT